VRLNDPEVVRAEYAEESRLEERIAAWQGLTGPNPRELALEAVAEAQPRRVLEVGCGQGWASEWIKDELGAEVVAVDQSERMVELTRRRGVDAHVGDVQDLAFEDGSFDAALAAWMLYHVPDLDRGLSELARVLRPGGRLVAVTNAPESLHELWTLLGADRTPFLIAGFHSDNGAEILRRHFQQVEVRQAAGTVTFADPEAVQRYVDSLVTVSGTVPPFEGDLVCSRRSTIFVAEKQ
jgi:ubiquinone/menaquinone biosynthesis C-methylase UbiE